MSQIAGQVHTLEIRTAWEVDPRSVPVVANQVMLRMAPGLANSPVGVQLTLGFVNSPVTSDGQRPEGVQEIPVVAVGDFYVPIDVAARLHEQLGELLNQTTGDVSK